MMPKEPRHRGRPKFPAGESKDSMIALRLRAEDAESVHAAAAKARMDVSEYIRGRLLGTEKPAQADKPTVLQWPDAGVFIQTPQPMSVELWEKLRKYIDVLRPQEKETPAVVS